MNTQGKPVTNRIKRKKEKTKNAIIATAMKLFKSYGFDNTTMERIAEEADIAKGTLYNYFSSKEAIIAEEIRMSTMQEHDTFVKKIESMRSTKSRMKFVLSELMKKIQDNKEVFEKYLAYRMQRMISLQWDFDESVKSGVYLLGYKIIELGQKENELRTDLPPIVLEEFFEFIFIGVIKQYYNVPDEFNASQAIDQAVELFMNGVSN